MSVSAEQMRHGRFTRLAKQTQATADHEKGTHLTSVRLKGNLHTLQNAFLERNMRNEKAATTVDTCHRNMVQIFSKGSTVLLAGIELMKLDCRCQWSFSFTYSRDIHFCKTRYRCQVIPLATIPISRESRSRKKTDLISARFQISWFTAAPFRLRQSPWMPHHLIAHSSVIGQTHRMQSIPLVRLSMSTCPSQPPTYASHFTECPPSLAMRRTTISRGRDQL
jgi:hypothetical protein